MRGWMYLLDMSNNLPVDLYLFVAELSWNGCERRQYIFTVFEANDC